MAGTPEMWPEKRASPCTFSETASCRARLRLSTSIAYERAGDRRYRSARSRGVCSVDDQPFDFKRRPASLQVNACASAADGPRGGSRVNTRHRVVNTWRGDHANDRSPAHHRIIEVKAKPQPHNVRGSNTANTFFIF